MICSNCGKEIPDGALFCSACGGITEYGIAATPEKATVTPVSGPWKLVAWLIGAALMAALVICVAFVVIPKSQKQPAKLFKDCDLSFMGYTASSLQDYAVAHGLQPDAEEMEGLSVVEVYLNLTSLVDRPFMVEQMLGGYYQYAAEPEIVYPKKEIREKKNDATDKKTEDPASEEKEDKAPPIYPMPTFWLCLDEENDKYDEQYLMVPEGYRSNGEIYAWYERDADFPEDQMPLMHSMELGNYCNLVLGVSGKIDMSKIDSYYVAACYRDKIYYWDLEDVMVDTPAVQHNIGYYWNLYGEYTFAEFLPAKQFGDFDLRFNGYQISPMEKYFENNGLTTNTKISEDQAVIDIYVDLTSLAEQPTEIEELLDTYLSNKSPSYVRPQQLVTTEMLNAAAKADSGDEDAAAPGIAPMPTFWLCQDNEYKTILQSLDVEAYRQDGSVYERSSERTEDKEAGEIVRHMLENGQQLNLVFSAVGEYDADMIGDLCVAAYYQGKVFYWDIDNVMEKTPEIQHDISYYRALLGSSSVKFDVENTTADADTK